MLSENRLSEQVFWKWAQSNGTITDVDGNFTLQVPEGTKLEVSFLGYKSQQIVVGAQSHYKVVLKEDTEVLDEVVVVGYGVKQKRSTMTTAISKMDSKVLENAAIANAAQALQVLSVVCG